MATQKRLFPDPEVGLGERLILGRFLPIFMNIHQNYRNRKFFAQHCDYLSPVEYLSTFLVQNSLLSNFQFFANFLTEAINDYF